MKKVLSIFLALVMVLSFASVAFAAGKDEDVDFAQIFADKVIDENFVNAFNGKTLDFPASVNVAPYYVGGVYHVDKILENRDLMKQIQFLGVDLDFVYNETTTLDWGRMSVSRGDMATLYGEMNTYIVSYMKVNYTNEDRLCSPSHATGLCNFIGHLLSKNYHDQTITSPDRFMQRATFYTEIANRSGLVDAIKEGWLTEGRELTCSKCKKSFSKSVAEVTGKTYIECPYCKETYGISTFSIKTTYDRKFDYRPFLVNTLSVPLYLENGAGVTWGDFEEYFTEPKYEYKNPSELGAFIVKSIVENTINNGPFSYLLSILKSLSDHYVSASAVSTVPKAVAGLLCKKISEGCATENALKTDLGVVFNTLVNDNNVNNTGKLQFVRFPTRRFSATANETEQFLYLMTYTNLLGKHLNNKAVVNGYKAKVSACNDFEYESKKTYTNMMIDAMFFGDLTTLANNMNYISKDNLHNIPSNWGWNFGDFFARMIRSITRFFDGIFQTLKHGINLDLIG